MAKQAATTRTVNKPAAVAPPARRQAAPSAPPPVQRPAAAPAPKPQHADVAGTTRPAAKVSTSKRYEFGDPNVKGGFSDRPEMFKGKPGYTYRIRIVAMPQSFFGSYVENKADPSKSFFCPSRAPYDVAEAAYQGDDEASKRAAEACPLWERGYKIQQKFICGIYVVERSDSKGRTEKVRQFVPWSFGGERYKAFGNIVAALPARPDGRPGSIRSIEILAQCTDDRYQKFSLTPVMGESRMKWGEVWAECKDHFSGDNPDSDCQVIDDAVAPDDKRKMIESLDRAEGRGQGAVEEPDAPAPTARRAGGAAPARAPRQPDPEPDAGDPGAEIDAALEGLGGDEGGTYEEGDGGGVESGGDPEVDLDEAP